MAKQQGVFNLRGTIGDVTFYRTQDGYLARAKSSIDRNRVKNDPAFQRTRENAAEFGRAGKACKVLRYSLRGLLLHSADSRMVSRLTKEMLNVVRADAVNIRGMRNVIDGDAELLMGFEFNIMAHLAGSFSAPIETVMDRVSGSLSVDIASFVPKDMISAPAGTTHYKISAIGTAVNFEAESFVSSTSITAFLPWDSAPTVAISLVNSVTAGSVSPLFLALGLAFYQEVNGEQYLLRDGAFNAVALVGVSGV